MLPDPVTRRTILISKLTRTSDRKENFSKNIIEVLENNKIIIDNSAKILARHPNNSYVVIASTNETNIATRFIAENINIYRWQPLKLRDHPVAIRLAMETAEKILSGARAYCAEQGTESVEILESLNNELKTYKFEGPNAPFFMNLLGSTVNVENPDDIIFLREKTGNDHIRIIFAGHGLDKIDYSIISGHSLHELRNELTTILGIFTTIEAPPKKIRINMNSCRNVAVNEEFSSEYSIVGGLMEELNRLPQNVEIEVVAAPWNTAIHPDGKSSIRFDTNINEQHFSAMKPKKNISNSK